MAQQDDSRPTDQEMNDWHWRLLSRHFSGIASPEEEAWLQEWEIADPDRIDLVRKLRTVWDLSAGGLEEGRTPNARPAGASAREAWGRLANRIHEQDRGKQETRPGQASQPFRNRPRRRRPGLLSVQVAALIAAVSLCAVLWRPVADILERRSDPPAMREFVADQGERVQATLSDGTRILLGPDSRVRMPVRFASDVRSLELEGIAFFEVAKDPQRPFRIRVRDAVVEVLGTAFVLRAYPTDPGLEVAVSEGRVALQPQASDTIPRVVLARSQVARLGTNGMVSVSADPLALERHLAWTDGRLAFQDAPLRRVFQDLERWYGAKLRAGTAELGSELLTLSIKGETLEQVIDLIALSLDLRYERDGEVVVFYPKESGR